MRAQCPHCGFAGNIRDDLIPEGGRTISCPKCKHTFLVQRSGDSLDRPLTEMKDTGRPRPAVAGSAAPPRSAPRKTNLFLIVIVAVLLVVLGFFAGYQYRGFIDDRIAPKTKVEKPKKAPKKHPPNSGPKRDRHPLMTPKGTPAAGIPPGNPQEWKSEKSFTADTLFDTLSAMPPGQARNFCRKNSTAEVNGNGTIREIKKTSTNDSIIGIYSITVECGADTRAVITSKMTESYLSNFGVGGSVGFIGILADYTVSGKHKTIHLADGMIVVK
jgi:predicted Zn finger-like uncharacterized protein